MALIHASVYHITHIDNLASIVQANGLQSCNLLARDGVSFSNIAFTEIQDRRAKTIVTCSPGGSLHDYVPFYFAPRSPMLYTINKGNVPNCDFDQEPIIHIRSTIQIISNAAHMFVFTDGHGIMAFSSFYNDIQYLDKVDWELMKSKYWHDTLSDNDRKRRRQAEFLVRDFFPFELIIEIGVMNRNVKMQVDAILAKKLNAPIVTVQNTWYY